MEDRPLHSQSDTELIVLMSQGDANAFAEIYSRHKASIYRYCVRMLGEKSWAEDATHDTFIKMFQNIASLQNHDYFIGWLFRIARNEVLMMLRKHKENGRDNDDSLWDESTPLDIAIGAETTALVQQTIQKLKKEYREVIVLREYEQLSYQQIADITGDTESSVKSRLFKARQALLKKLKSYYQ